MKHIRLFDYDGPILADPNSSVSPNDTIDIEIFGPGQKDWPRRVKYPEQIPDLRNQNYVVWVVKIIDGEIGTLIPPWNKVQTEVVRVAQPTVVTFWPDSLNPAVPLSAHRPVNPNKLTKIDEQKFVSYFLSDGDGQKHPHDLIQCGIIPNERLNYNATFYDSEVAHLYANSIEHQLRLGSRI